MFRLKGELSRLETDKLSLESMVHSLNKMVQGLEEEERSLQEQLNIALGGGVSGIVAAVYGNIVCNYCACTRSARSADSYCMYSYHLRLWTVYKTPVKRVS